MAKQAQPQLAHQHDRGTITDNALKAVVTSKLFTTRVVKAKKGKGSYSRKGRNSKDYGLVVCGISCSATQALAVRHKANHS
ncbi:ribosome alternative rescue factor ArfA [Rheinheimera sp.]|uniref:alternative ribosome-rescue factor A n=1 Tax=Rheinheimera sp. TaxID=1869214 RepID=UPI00307ED177